MKRKTSKILGFLLAVFMAAGLLSPNARAEDSLIKYPVWIGNTQVTSENKDDVLEDGGSVKYTPATESDAAKLVLNDPSISDVYTDADGLESVIYAAEALDIEGKATLSGTDCGIRATVGRLKIIDAEMNVSGTLYGIYSDAYLAIEGGSVTVDATDYAVSTAIFSENTVFLESGGSVSATGGTAIASSKDVYIAYSAGTITATGKQFYGISSSDYIHIDGGTVKASGPMYGISGKKVVIGPDVPFEVTADSDATAIYGEESLYLGTYVMVTEPTSYTKTTHTILGDDGIHDATHVKLILDDIYPVYIGEKKLSAHNVTNDKAQFDPGTNTLTLDSPTIDTEHSGYWSRIASEGIDLTVKGKASLSSQGNVLKAAGDPKDGSGGNLTVDGAELNLSGWSTGLSSDKALVITGNSSVTATGRDNSGIYGSSGVTIDSGTVTAECTKNGSGIRTWDGDIVITGGSVKTTCLGDPDSWKPLGYGIESRTGAIVISGGTVEATGYTRAFYTDPDLSGYKNPIVTVNTEAKAEGAAAWDGTTPLGGDGSPYKYVKIEQGAIPKYGITVIGGKAYSDAAKTAEIIEAAEGDTIYIKFNDPADGKFVSDITYSEGFFYQTMYTGGVTMPAKAVTFEIKTEDRQTVTIDLTSGSAATLLTALFYNVPYDYEYGILLTAPPIDVDLDKDGNKDITVTEYDPGTNSATVVPHAETKLTGSYDKIPDSANTPYSKVTFVFSKGETPITYTVTFDPNSGSGTMTPNPVTVKEGEKLTLPECTFTPPSADKEFDKWDAGKPGEQVDVISDCVIRAIWKEKAVTTYTVTFDANGHGTAPAAQTVEDGKMAAKPADPTETGWTFGGWFKEAACTNAFDFSTPITVDVTLYAKWLPNVVGLKVHSTGPEKNGEGKYQLAIDKTEAVFAVTTDATVSLLSFTALSSGQDYDDPKLTTAPMPGTEYYFWLTVEAGTEGDPAVFWTDDMKTGGEALVDSGTLTLVKITHSAGGSQASLLYTYVEKDPTYTVTGGGNSSRTKGSASTLTVTVKRDPADNLCFDHFTAVKIGSQTLTPGTDYEAAAGSTVVTIKASALNALAVGTHTVTVIFNDGSVATLLTVKAAPTMPDTGESAELGLWTAVMTVSAMGFCWTLIRRKQLLLTDW